MVNFPHLESCGNVNGLNGDPYFELSLNRLPNLEAVYFPKLKTCLDINFNILPKLVEDVKFPSLTHSKYIVATNTGMNGLDLPLLEELTYTDDIDSNKIGLELSNNANLSDLNVPKLRSVEGQITFRNLDSLLHINLPSLIDAKLIQVISNLSLERLDLPSLMKLATTEEDGGDDAGLEIESNAMLLYLS